MQMKNTLSIGSILVAAIILSGCASSGVKYPSGVPVTEMRPDERGFVAGTGVESQDLVAVTDKMARNILNVRQIANAQGTPRVILDPVVNETRFPINKDIFLARERMAALEKERQLKQSGQVTSSTDPNVVAFKGADFVLTGKLQGLTTKTAAGTSDYVLYSFQLIDVNTSDIIWEGSSEIKKQGLEDAAYR